MPILGLNLMVWNGQVGAAELTLLPQIKAMGYASIELPVFAADPFDSATVHAALADQGLACTVSTAPPPAVNLIDADRRAAGIDYLRQVITVAANVGATVVCGPLAAPVGERRGRGYTQAEWDSCVLGLRAAGAIAADHGVTLALEPLNRFETFIVNTVADGVRLVAEIDQPAVGLLWDTFHMHIEEKSTAAAIRQAGRYIKHFHASENDRGTVGTGQVAWPSVFGALRDINYQGQIVVESFGHAIAELAGAACVWRPLAASPAALAQGSITYLRKHLS